MTTVPPFFPPEALAQIRKGKVFSGGIRHKEIVGPLLPAGAEWISITVPLDRVFSRYEEIFARFEETATDDSIIVFASGDPLFFGFANTIKRKLPGADILLYPAFNSLQTLAHRLVMPYDDMRTVSLTGRPWQEFDRALIERAPQNRHPHRPRTYPGHHCRPHAGIRVLPLHAIHRRASRQSRKGTHTPDDTPRKRLPVTSNIPTACCLSAIPDNAAQTPCTATYKPRTFQSVLSAFPMKSLPILTDAPA